MKKDDRVEVPLTTDDVNALLEVMEEFLASDELQQEAIAEAMAIASESSAHVLGEHNPDIPDKEFDVTDIIHDEVMPLVHLVRDRCNNLKIPFQAAFVSSKQESVVNTIRIEPESQNPIVWAAHHIYDLPHPVAHFVIMASSLHTMMPTPQMMTVDPFDQRDEYTETVLPTIKDIWELCERHNVPFQWCAIVAVDHNKLYMHGSIYNERETFSCQMKAAAAVYLCHLATVRDVIELAVELGFAK